MNLAEKICCAIRDSGYGIEAETGEKFAEYLRFLTEYNRSVNLTAITDEDGIILKHFVDSLSALPYTDCCAEVLDLGSGAGFPGVPMKLVRPDIRLTALDSSGKKCAFLRALTARIGVGAEILEGRAEETGRGTRRASFDVVVTRAVAELRVLAELGLPLLKTGGKLIAYKGRPDLEEITAGDRAASALGGLAAELVRTATGPEARTLVIYSKTGETPSKYPRRYARITGDPI